MLGRPIEKYRQDLDCHNVSVNNYPLVIQRTNFAYDPMPGQVYLCGRCQCRERYKMDRYLRNDMEPQNVRHADSSNLCECSFCGCLSCHYQKDASFAGSLENYKTNVMCKYIENEWKDRMRREGCDAQCRAARNGKQPDKNIIINKNNNEIKSEQSGLIKNARLCRSCQQRTQSHKMPVEEMLDDVYGTDFSVNNKGVSTVKPNKILSSQLQNDYGVYALVNTETNTELITVDRSVNTIDFLKKIPDRVKNYEYTLKIEIISPKVDDNGKSATKQKITKVSKNKIKEQTQKVMNDLVKDISNSSLLQEVYAAEKPDELLNTDTPVKDESQEQKRRSILKQKLSPESSLTRAPSLKQHFSNIVWPPVTSAAKSNKVSNKIDDFMVSCFAPIQNESHSTVKMKDESNPELQSKDLSMISQNDWTLTPPVKPWALNPDDEIEKIVSNFDVPTTDSTDADKIIENKSKLRDFVDDLRVKELCLRRVSYHTVSLRWKLPKALKEVIGYEILVDGNTIEKILNPRRCLAVVSCLPPVQRLLITIRTITNNPRLDGLLPCTTIGYQPRASKYMRI